MVIANRAGTDPFRASSKGWFMWEKFLILHNPDGTVSLLARANWRYASVKDDGKILADSFDITPKQKFDMIKCAGNDGTVAFKSKANGKYINSKNQDALLEANVDPITNHKMATCFYVTSKPDTLSMNSN